MFNELDLLISEVRGKSADCRISDGELEALLGSWPFDKRSADAEAEARLRRFLELITLALWLFGDTAPTWMRAPNAGLSRQSPLAVMLKDPRMIATLRDVLRSEVDCP
ncbi:hypothetical protein A3718_05475 [Erythrobacter sp. HI0019]|uniref:hypothetical protein n=1 Tax=unclassified Erythrobacter TaxID=2633097 RepID=UPI0007B92468|nr:MULTISPECIES: hypothetical protein [unclassified Erythrobacter]KZX85958.1 hypothetical protein A3718_05475 [Erythrobacter sp. HI0019]KZY10025.1 hypothetical protein A3723_08235 [Erythrobacter sp. HI0028]